LEEAPALARDILTTLPSLHGVSLFLMSAGAWPTPMASIHCDIDASIHEDGVRSLAALHRSSLHVVFDQVFHGHDAHPAHAYLRALLLPCCIS
jgi:hypothetical protein